MAELVHLSKTSSVDEIIEVLDKDAGVIIDNLIDQDEVEALNQDLSLIHI